jgi:hypothetical protein
MPAIATPNLGTDCRLENRTIDLDASLTGFQPTPIAVCSSPASESLCPDQPKLEPEQDDLPFQVSCQ